MRRTILLSLLGGVTIVLALSSIVHAQDESQPATDTTSGATVLPGDQPAMAVDSGGYGPGPSIARRFGMPSVSAQPGGLKLGALTIVDLSNSGFVVFATAPGQASQTASGFSTSSDITYQYRSGKNFLSFQATPQVSVTQGQAFLNTESGVSFTRFLSSRWTLSATNQFAFLQNTRLQTAQTLAQGGGGLYLQNYYIQQMGSVAYDSSNISLTYLMNGRTQLSLLPQVGLTFADQNGQPDLIAYLGGGVTISRNLNARRSVSVSLSLLHSTTLEGSPGSSGSWNSVNFGVGLQQQIGQTIWISGNLSGSYQGTANSTLVPAGSIGITKAFRNGSFSLGYSRSEAQQYLVSSGYFDQASVSYTRRFGRNISIAAGGGAFRTVQTVSSSNGKRLNGSFSYHWIRNLSWLASYNYSTQNGNQPDLSVGNTTFLSFGLTWNLGSVPRT